MRVVTRRMRGWTLHEMLISLGVMGGVLALASHAMSGQMRFFQGVGEIVALRGQLGDAAAIVTNVLWAASPAAGDVVAAMDSAIEARVTIGSAIVCASTPGRVVIPAPTTERGNVLGAFADPPRPGDRLVVLFEDSSSATWLTLHIASAPSVAHEGCAAYDVERAWSLDLHEQIPLPEGALLRFTRPLRLSLYRSSDRRWYLGARDWNGDAQRFNTIQPVAGPLQPYSAIPGRSGLEFLYGDSLGEPLAPPLSLDRIAIVTVVVRGETRSPVRMKGVGTRPGGSYADSIAISIAFRNGR